MTALLAHFIADDQGQDLIEYGLLGTFISLMGYVGADLLGTSLNGWYELMKDNVDKAQTASTIP